MYSGTSRGIVVCRIKASYILVGIGVVGIGRIRFSMVWCCRFHGVSVPCRVVWCVEWCDV